MTDMTSGVSARSTVTGGALYRLVWKWHFLASLFVLPFMAMLAITGGIYLYKPQIEEIIYADRLNVPVGETQVSYEDQIAAVEAQAGITRLRSVKTENVPGRATLIEFNDGDKVRSYAWVNPYTAEVLAVQARDDTLMRMLRKFHGELLLGKFGTKFVELSAHWALVMFVTGVYLWWPRGQRGWAQAFSLPRGEGRSWWRETHMFTGILAVVLVTPILISGLPWTDIWGGGLSFIQKQTGQKSGSLRFGGKVPDSVVSDSPALSIAEVFAIAEAQGLKAPYQMRPAKGPEGSIWIRSASRNRSEQTEMVLDQYSGEVLKTHRFAENPPVARLVSYGISFHQGELYGWLNLVQNTIASVLALILSVSGFVAWWMRRPAGSLGVPAAPEAVLSPGMMVLVVVLSILLPLVGLSLIVALLLDWLLFRRLGWFQSQRPASER